MLNSEDPMLSSSPRDFSHQRPMRRHRMMATTSVASLNQWQHDTSLQVSAISSKVPLTNDVI